MAEIAELVKLWQDRRRPSASVKKLAERHAEELDRKIIELRSMRKTLSHLIHCCQGDERPDCPILEDLESFAPGGVAAGPDKAPAPRKTAKRA
jgi:hypothetical protein